MPAEAGEGGWQVYLTCWLDGTTLIGGAQDSLNFVPPPSATEEGGEPPEGEGEEGPSVAPSVTEHDDEGNRPPVAEPDRYELAEGEGLDLQSPGVLGNDRDPDGDVLTAVYNAKIATTKGLVEVALAGCTSGGVAARRVRGRRRRPHLQPDH